MKSQIIKNLSKTLNPKKLPQKLIPSLKFSSGFETPSKIEDENIDKSCKLLPRPSEIPFQSKVANIVNLIGTIRMPIEFITTSNGQSWAGTVISQHQKSFSTPLLWIPIIFEGDLAHTAVTHLKVLDNVYVAGRLCPDPLPINLTNDRVDVQVIVHDLHFVRGCPHTKKNHH